MSICDNCIHDYVCGLEDNHEEGIVSCSDRISKDAFDKIRSEIENHCGLAKENHCKYCSYCNSVMGVREILELFDKYKVESEK